MEVTSAQQPQGLQTAIGKEVEGWLAGSPCGGTSGPGQAMLGTEQIRELEEAIRQVALADRKRFEEVREEVRGLRDRVRPIRPRITTAVSLVSADAGENVIEFDPYLLMPVRVVDSHGQVLFMDALSPLTDTGVLNRRHLEGGKAKTPLGRLMQDLGVASLWELSPMIPEPGTLPDRIKPGWVKVYRDLGEWAAFYEYLTRHTFASHTLVVRDGFLRSKIFANDNFTRMWERIEEAVHQLRKKTGRRVFVVGIARRSKVIDRYRLAMFLEGVLFQPGACFVHIPREIEKKVYRWSEYARGIGEVEEGEKPKFVAGSLFLAKFGPGRYDPVWPVDVWSLHVRNGEEEEIFSYLLADAQVGFPRPFYPLCLQRAHEKASLSGLDLEILQRAVVRAIKEALPSDESHIFDAFRLVTAAGRGELP